MRLVALSSGSCKATDADLEVTGTPVTAALLACLSLHKHGGRPKSTMKTSHANAGSYMHSDF